MPRFEKVRCGQLLQDSNEQDTFLSVGLAGARQDSTE
jgi:hypothetical protein